MNATKLTQDWLRVAFGVVPTLTKEQKVAKAELIKKLLIEEVDEYIEAVKNNDYNEELNACSDLLFVANNLPYFSQISEYDLEQENIAVYHSNMTKFCRSEEEAKESVAMYAKGEHPNKMGVKIESMYMPTGHSEFPFRVQTLDGKIMKSHNFLDVDNFR